MTSGRPNRFKAGDRVRLLAGEAKGTLGTVTRRPLQDRTKSIHPAGDTSSVFVVFDDTGTALKVSVDRIARIMG